MQHFFLLNTKHQSGVHFFQQLLHDSPLPIDTYTQCYINMLASIFNLCQRTSVRPYCFILLHETINIYFYVLFWCLFTLSNWLACIIGGAYFAYLVYVEYIETNTRTLIYLHFIFNHFICSNYKLYVIPFSFLFKILRKLNYSNINLNFRYYTFVRK